METINLLQIKLDNAQDGPRLLAIENWGDASWVSMERAFTGCTNLQITATDTPDLSHVTNMSAMFAGCTNLNSPNNIGTWNTAAVTDMSFLFTDAREFNQDIGIWNTGNVITMNSMFFQALKFNQKLS